MLQLNDGILEVYSKKTEEDSDCFDEKLIFLKKMWFSFLEIGVKEYYLDKQSQGKLIKRVRIHRDRDINTQNVIVIEERKYCVGRVFHGVNKKNIPITDISLERIEAVL